MTRDFLVVPAPVVERILAADPARVVALVEQAYRRHASGEAVNPPSHFLRLPDRPGSRIIALPAALGPDPGVAGLKWISSFPGNLARGLPRASAVLILNDGATGFPIACMESSILSATRTAASAALAAARLGHRRGRRGRVGYIGAGLIAGYIHRYLGTVGWPFQQVRVLDVDRSRAEAFAARMRATAPGGPVDVCDSAEELIRSSDLVVTATTAPTPHIHDVGWFRHHPLVLHVSLRDIGIDIVLDAVNVVDDIDHCLRAETSVHLAEQRVGHRRFIHATLAEVLAGGVTAPADRTVIFSPFGLGTLDLTLAQAVYAQCRTEGSGIPVADFFGGLHPDGPVPPAGSPGPSESSG